MELELPSFNTITLAATRTAAVRALCSKDVCGQNRTRHSSWSALPQHLRGIRLSELEALCQEHRAWLEQPRWRCTVCRRSCCCRNCQGSMPSPASADRHTFRLMATSLLKSSRSVVRATHGKCREAGCPSTSGTYQMRNLYEVNEQVIKPKCVNLQVSYVEMLRLREIAAGSGVTSHGVKVDTFVSHWWGEEFPNLVKTLRKFAKFQCEGKCRKQGQFLDWSFWICAFANNQFAVEHAVGLNGDVSQSAFAVALRSCREMVAVIDNHAQIYRRIWCAFELFCADSAPHRPTIWLANEQGVISAGSANWSTVKQMQNLINTVHVAEAEASVENDRDMILGILTAANVSMDCLDALLRKQMQEGLRMVCLRGHFFFAVMVEIICGMMLVITGMPSSFGSSSYMRQPHYYLDWFLFVHIPLAAFFDVFAFFLVVVAYSGEEGRNSVMDWFPSAALRWESSRTRAVAVAFLLLSLLALGLTLVKEVNHTWVPELNAEHPRRITFCLAVLCLVELCALYLRLVPRRLVPRMAAFQFAAVLLGALAGRWILQRSSPFKLVVLLVSNVLLALCYTTFLRDRCPGMRRRLEEPFWG